MKLKSLFIFLGMFLFYYFFNYLTPMSFGDDYVYSFIWEGHPMYTPLSDNAARVNSYYDLFISQKSHYFTGNGRTINHLIAQFFLWKGKDVFDLCNALISVLLIAIIYWYSHKGLVSLRFKPGTLCWIFFVLWAFTPGFSPVFFWLCGACNYLWTAVLLSGFLLPYVRKYYSLRETIADNAWFQYFMFIFGILTGWTNENSVCWIILVLSLFLFANRKQKQNEAWMFTGLAGLILGYAFLMLAPGNVSRLHAEIGSTTSWISLGLLKQNFNRLAAVFLFHFLLWYFTIRSLFILKQKKIALKDTFLVKVLCLISFGMTTLMVLSPNFPPRSAFPGTVQLIVAACILLRIQEDYKILLIQKRAKKLLFYVGVFYFMITSVTSYYGFYNYHVQMQELLQFVKNTNHTKEEIITVRPFKAVSDVVNNASGFHLIFYELSEDDNDWRNVAFARYYGIKGIRLKKIMEGNMNLE